MKYLLTNQETERLQFRLLVPEDFDAWLPLFKTKNIAKFLGLDVKLSEVGLCTNWFDKAFHRYENDLGGMNVLVAKETNTLVGQAGLLVQTIEKEARLEVGYSILPNYWNQGYAYEAAAKCKNYAFENNFSPTLISSIHTENIASEKVALKNGMSFEKKVKNYNVFSINRSEWYKDNSSP